MALVVKNPLASTGDIRDAGSIQGWGRSPGEGHSNPPTTVFLLGEPHGRGAWQATVHSVADLDMTEVTWYAHKHERS